MQINSGVFVHVSEQVLVKCCDPFTLCLAFQGMLLLRGTCAMWCPLWCMRWCHAYSGRCHRLKPGDVAMCVLGSCSRCDVPPPPAPVPSVPLREKEFVSTTTPRSLLSFSLFLLPLCVCLWAFVIWGSCPSLPVFHCLVVAGCTGGSLGNLLLFTQLLVKCAAL